MIDIKNRKTETHQDRQVDHGLEAVLAGFEPRICELFGIALTIFAGPHASSMTEAEKLNRLKGKIEE